MSENNREFRYQPNNAGVRIAAVSDKKPRIESNHLFQGNSEIVIVHQREEYNLRNTRNGRLILTK